LQHLFVQRAHETDAYLLIGQVASITGASCKAIRHYERMGLLPTPARRGRYRVYSQQDVFLVHMLKFGQRFGFSLNELREIADDKVRDGAFPLAKAHVLCQRKRESIRAEIAALERLDQELVSLEQEMSRIFAANRDTVS
jgi:DNA-binding transcriptional MerR regulator